MIKALWLCNIIIPAFSDIYGIKKNPYGGWISGMLDALSTESNIEVSFLFPVRDSARKKHGEYDRYKFFSFDDNISDRSKVSKERISFFSDVLEEYEPDVIHVWGTEYAWSLEMTIACKEKGILDKLLINIQGFVSICERHFFEGIPKEYIVKKVEGVKSVWDEQQDFFLRGKNEIKLLKEAVNICGRTDWDKACALSVNPCLNYFHSREIIRPIFYDNAGQWEWDSCRKKSIFVSQVSYPIKGFHYLIRALYYVKRKYPQLSVYVAGNDITLSTDCSSYAQYIVDEINRLQLADTIHFTGNVSAEEMVSYYRDANVFVSASLEENSPNSVCEAMLIGVPVISSFVGGIQTMLSHNVEGLLYPSHEPELLSMYIMECFERRDLCERFSRNASNKAAEFVSRPKAKEELISIYKTIFQQSKVNCNQL